MRVLAVLALVGANAFFPVGEYAVVTARRGALAQRAKAGTPGARAACGSWTTRCGRCPPCRGITAIGILTGAIGQPLIGELLGGALPAWASLAVALGVVTYLSVVPRTRPPRP